MRDEEGTVLVGPAVRRTGACVLLALTFALCGLSALPAYADDDPSGYGSPGDPFGGQTIPPGPVYVLTPGASPGTGLPASSDPDDVEKQIQEDIAKNTTATDVPSGTPTSTATPVAGSTDDADGSSDATDTSAVAATKADEDSGSRTWVIVVAVLLALVVAGGVARVLQLRRRAA